MPGRPPLPLGSAGRVRTVVLADGRVQARCLFRDSDGRTRPVTRIGKTGAAAQRELTKALTERRKVAGVGEVRSDMSIADLADQWLERVIDPSDKAVNTKQQYRKLVDAYIKPTMGSLRVAEATVGRCDAALTSINATRGKSVAKSCRAVLSGMLGYAARRDAIPTNPVRDAEAIAGASVPKKGRPRALTIREAEDVSDRLRTLTRAVDLDMPDLVDMALATGARIGELLAARHGYNQDGKPLLDLDAGTWEVNATIVRVKAAGLIVQQRTKTEAGWRILALPAHIVDMLRDRRDNPTSIARTGPATVVFGSPGRRALRDPSNCAGDLRTALRDVAADDDRTEWAWVTFHTFRKTVATRMEEAGCTPREVADQLGHSKPSMTQDLYFGRTVVSAKAATILAR